MIRTSRWKVWFYQSVYLLPENVSNRKFSAEVPVSYTAYIFWGNGDCPSWLTQCYVAAQWIFEVLLRTRNITGIKLAVFGEIRRGIKFIFKVRGSGRTNTFRKNSCAINTLRPKTNGRHFGDIFKSIFGVKVNVFWLKLYWILIPWVQLIICQHWFR